MKTRTILTMASAALLLACTSLAASADTWVFKDVVRPHGASRSMKAKLADAHKCGAVGDSIPDAVLPGMQSCMWAHGWALDHIVDAPAPRWDASNDAERQRDEESRNDESQRQMQDQINNDAMMSTLNNQ